MPALYSVHAGITINIDMPEVVPPPSAISLATLLAPGIAAVKKFYRPFLLLQAAAVLLVIAYYSSYRVQTFCEQLTRFKEQGGLVFTAIASAIAGGLIPEIAKAIMLGEHKIDSRRLRNIGFALLVFGSNGILIDLQYRVFAHFLGYDHHVRTIIEKVLLDQFVTTPIYGVPWALILYSLRAHRYHLFATLGELSLRWYVTCALPLLIPCWCFWIPITSAVYSLPVPLQFCLFLLALAAWSLMVVFVATYEGPAGLL
jgi:hypothetical protein